MRSIGDLQNVFVKLEKEVLKLKTNFEENLGKAVVRDIDENFTKAGVDKGKKGGFEKWEVSKAALKRKDPLRPTLTNTRRLRKSVKYEIDGGVLRIGINLSKVPYGKIHQEGLGNIPKRAFLYIKDETIDEAIKKTEKEISVKL